MNYIRAQKEIFNNLVNGDRVCGYWQDAESYFVTGDGFHGFIFPASTIAFDTAKVNEIKRLFEVPEIMVDREKIDDTCYKIIEFLEAQEPVEPEVDVDQWRCGKCGHLLEHQELLGLSVLSLLSVHLMD